MSKLNRIDHTTKINLADFDPSAVVKIDKDAVDAAMVDLGTRLSELQEILYAAQMNSVLIVLQGMDTSGKDGVISHVMTHVNPQGCAVASFKVPTPEQLAHDFLWRIHQHAPAKGTIAIFNRSHYEDVLVTRVHHLIDKDTCEERYEQIRHFEDLLARNGTIVLKFFLHISKDEQERRLKAREADDTKAWKLSPGDWTERTFWDDYTHAYEFAIGATASKRAPWYVVPANHKWSRNLTIATAIVNALSEHRASWTEALKKMGVERKAELASG